MEKKSIQFTDSGNSLEFLYFLGMEPLSLSSDSDAATPLLRVPFSTDLTAVTPIEESQSRDVNQLSLAFYIDEHNTMQDPSPGQVEQRNAHVSDASAKKVAAISETEPYAFHMHKAGDGEATESRRNAEAVWSECLEFLRDNMNLQAFSTWFEPIIALKLDGDSLTVQVKSHFIYEFIEENYYNILRSAVTKAIGPGAKILYSVEVVKTVNQTPSVVLTLPQQHLVSPPTPPPPTHPDSLKRNTIYHTNAPLFQGHLNPKYLFDSYIKGDCNMLAYAAAKSVAENPGNNSYNPLFIYGGVGLGKTHLIQAIGNYARAKQKADYVVYVSSEKFTLDFVSAIQNDKIRQFSEFYRNVDLLIIDDIQFFAGKGRTQDEFFYIFNALHQSNKQIVLTSDRPPKDIRDIEERLLSRFSSGLSADLQQPDFETRLAILNRKSEEHGISLPADVAHFICTNVTSNIREMEGCLIKLLATSSIAHCDIDLPLAKTALRDMIREKSKIISLEMIEKIVCDYFSLSANDLKGKSRKKEIAEARQTAMFLAKEQTGKSLKTIGLHFGGRDHSTVIHAITTVEERITNSFEMRHLIDELRKRLDIISL